MGREEGTGRAHTCAVEASISLYMQGINHMYTERESQTKKHKQKRTEYSRLGKPLGTLAGRTLSPCVVRVVCVLIGLGWVRFSVRLEDER